MTMTDTHSTTGGGRTREIKRVCVFCGASHGGKQEYTAGAFDVGRSLAARNIGLVYGGGRAGLMGAVADSCLGAGGHVTGVITKLLEGKELGHTGIQELHVVETMHDRKMMMATMSDAFIALPGGLGTLDEMFEILAWVQLGIHAKPVGVLNTGGFYDSLFQFLDHVEDEQFLRLNHRASIIVETDAARLLDRLANAPPTSGRFPSVAVR